MFPFFQKAFKSYSMRFCLKKKEKVKLHTPIRGSVRCRIIKNRVCTVLKCPHNSQKDSCVCSGKGTQPWDPLLLKLMIVFANVLSPH